MWSTARHELRILMLCYEFPPLGGGGGRAVDGLSRALVGLGHQVDLVTMGFRGEPARKVIEGVRVHRVPSFRARQYECRLDEAASYMLPALIKACRLASAQRYDITHAHFLLPDGINAVLLRRLAGLEYVVTTHGSDVPGYNAHRLRRTHRLAAPIWRRVAREAAQIICPSVSIQALFSASSPTTKIALIPYGFDADRFGTDGLGPGRLRHKRILAVTRLVERKGVQYLIEAVRDLDLEHAIHIVGDGPYLEELKARAVGCRPRIVFEGWLDNGSERLRELYCTSDIFVLASDAENFPVSLLEAMSARLAIVTTRGTGCQEVVGDAAVLVPPRDAGALRNALLSVTTAPGRSHRLGNAARERLEQNFGWKGIAQQHVALYRRAVLGHGRTAKSSDYRARRDTIEA